MRVGLLADIHLDFAPYPAAAEARLKAEGVDHIVVCGDVGDMAALEPLRRVAPVLAVRGAADVDEVGDLTATFAAGEGCTMAAVHTLAAPGTSSTREDLRRFFGADVDVVAYGGTHAASVDVNDGVLFVNPGSPNVPAEGTKPTIAIVAIGDDRPSAEVIEL